MNSPKVTVLMPVYNGERYLGQAIESILSQTFRDFEFIIIDGGSKDSTPAILAHYQQMDDRIRVYYQENQRLVDSLNMGCQLARGKYIARMDADDISLPQRLVRQVDFMEARPEIGILGTWAQSIDESGKKVENWHPPASPGLVGWCLILSNCLIHGSVMMRRNVVEEMGFYKPAASQAPEDYDLWARASLVTQVANIPEILVRYRVWQASTSAGHLKAMEEYADKVSQAMVTKLLNSEVTLDVATSLRRVARGLPLDNIKQVETSASLVHQLYRAYLKANALSSKEAGAVAQDAGIKLLFLAVLAVRFSLPKAAAIFAQALRLHPQLVLSRQLITKGINKGMRMLTKRA